METWADFSLPQMQALYMMTLAAMTHRLTLDRRVQMAELFNSVCGELARRRTVK